MSGDFCSVQGNCSAPQTYHDSAAYGYSGTNGAYGASVQSFANPNQSFAVQGQDAQLGGQADPWGMEGIVRQVVGVVRQLIERVVSSILDRLLGPVLGHSGPQADNAALTGANGIAVAGGAACECSSTQSPVQPTVSEEAGGGAESEGGIGKWVKKAVSWGEKIGKVVDWLGDKKEAVFSTVSKVWSGITSLF